MREALDLVSEGAKRDIRRELRPVNVMAVLAGALRPLPPLGRGIAAIVIPGLGVMAVCGGCCGCSGALLVRPRALAGVPRDRICG